MKKFQCFCCEKTLEPVCDGANNCYGAVVCIASGNFGSAFDPPNGEKLQFQLCDNCLTEKRKLVLHVDGELSAAWPGI